MIVPLYKFQYRVILAGIANADSCCQPRTHRHHNRQYYSVREKLNKDVDVPLFCRRENCAFCNSVRARKNYENDYVSTENLACTVLCEFTPRRRCSGILAQIRCGSGVGVGSSCLGVLARHWESLERNMSFGSEPNFRLQHAHTCGTEATFRCIPSVPLRLFPTRR